MFCNFHAVPQEECRHCRAVVTNLRPSIFAELAAAELRSGTECCVRCDYVFYQAVDRCPGCGELNPLHIEQCRDAVWQDTVPMPLLVTEIDGKGVDLDNFVMRDPFTHRLVP